MYLVVQDIIMDVLIRMSTVLERPSKNNRYYVDYQNTGWVFYA